MDYATGAAIPVSYDYINVVNSMSSPSTVHCKNTALSRYFQRYLLQKVMSLFKWNMPTTWNKDYFLYVLYCFGYVAIVNTNKYGVIPQHCTLTGYNVFYQPTNAIISNPKLRGVVEPLIDVQCTLIKLQPDYGGILDLVGYYADLMALCSETIGVNLVNSKLSYVFGANNKQGAESFKKLYDQVASGEPCAVYDKALRDADGSVAWEAFFQNVKQSYIASDVLSDMRKIETMFDTDIGIPNANTDKRERLVTDEVNANNVETVSKCSMWLEEMQESCEKARGMFDISLSVDWRFDPMPKARENMGGAGIGGSVS